MATWSGPTATGATGFTSSALAPTAKSRTATKNVHPSDRAAVVRMRRSSMTRSSGHQFIQTDGSPRSPVPCSNYCRIVPIRPMLVESRWSGSGGDAGSIGGTHYAPEGWVEERGPRRKLTTILCADCAGYSRMMGADEEGTYRALHASRELITRLVGGHEGRIFGSAGDSVIAEFPSPVEAVRAAAEIQQAVAELGAGVAEDRHMQFRIGINLGDVMIEGDDLIGDGVNIAARLQGLAEPGGICISGSVYEQVKSKLVLEWEDL